MTVAAFLHRELPNNSFFFSQTKFEMNERIGMYPVHAVEQGNLKVRLKYI